MNRLNEQFSDSVDFFYMDVDQPDTMQLVLDYGVRARSTYVLLDANGEVVTFWSGPLNEQIVAARIGELVGDS